MPRPAHPDRYIRAVVRDEAFYASLDEVAPTCPAHTRGVWQWARNVDQEEYRSEMRAARHAD
jgi:hypothetical protein